MPAPREAALAGAAARRVRHQAARVDRIDRHVGLGRRVDRSFQLRLVIDARLADAAGEVDQRLLFRQRRQHARGLLDGRQFGRC